MLKDNPSVTNVTAPFTQRRLSRPKILDVAINRATKPLGEEKSFSVLPKQATAYECTPSLCRWG